MTDTSSLEMYCTVQFEFVDADTAFAALQNATDGIGWSFEIEDTAHCHNTEWFTERYATAIPDSTTLKALAAFGDVTGPTLWFKSMPVWPLTASSYVHFMQWLMRQPGCLTSFAADNFALWDAEGSPDVDEIDMVWVATRNTSLYRDLSADADALLYTDAVEARLSELLDEFFDQHGLNTTVMRSLLGIGNGNWCSKEWETAIVVTDAIRA